MRRDLVESSGAGAGRRFCISRVGVARRRRQTAPPDLAFPAQHQDLVSARIAFEGRSAAVTLDASESPLDWLRRRKDASGAPLIDEACHQAGERLRLDLTLAAMLPRVTANWDAAVSDKARGAPRDPASSTHSAVAARQRVVRALEAVGSDFADLLIDLCGFLTGLAEIERARGWPVRSGKVIARARARPPRRSLRARPRSPRSGSLARRHGVAERRVAVSSRARTISARLRRRRGRRA